MPRREPWEAGAQILQESVLTTVAKYFVREPGAHLSASRQHMCSQAQYLLIFSHLSHALQGFGLFP